MNGKRAELEQRIEHSEVFQVNRAADPVRFRNLVYVLIEDLYAYVHTTCGLEYQNAGLEIVSVANRCLNSYQRDRGPFLHYFMSSLAREIRNEAARQKEWDMRGGIAIPEPAQRKISCIQALAGKMAREVSDPQVILAASAVLNIPQEQVEELILLNTQLAVIRESDTRTGQSFLDTVPDPHLPESYLLLQSGVEELLSGIELIFRTGCNSQKRVWQKLLTAKLIHCCPSILREAANMEFFDQALYNHYLQTGHVPTARELSTQLGKSEASISRTMAHFLRKVKENLSSTERRENKS